MIQIIKLMLIFSQTGVNKTKLSSVNDILKKFKKLQFYTIHHNKQDIINYKITEETYIYNFERSRVNALSLLHNSVSDLFQKVVATHFIFQAKVHCLYTSKQNRPAFTNFMTNELKYLNATCIKILSPPKTNKQYIRCLLA